jgi:hypothetical protein
MNQVLVWWFVIGMFAGGAHLWLLWVASQPPFHGAAWHLPRLLLIGGALFVSAVWGGLLPAVAGWMVAYFAGLGTVAIRSPR